MLHVLQLILSRVLLPFSWEGLDLIQWTQTITLLFLCLALHKSSPPVSDVWCHRAFHSTANSTLATDQLRSLSSCVGLEKFCKAAHEGLSHSFFSSVHNASPHQSGLRTCPCWCHSAPQWRLPCKVLQQCTDSTWPGNSTPFFLLCVKSKRALLTPILWAAMPCSSTLKRRASRSTTGCRKEDTIGWEICCPSLLSLEWVTDARNEGRRMWLQTVLLNLCLDWEPVSFSEMLHWLICFLKVAWEKSLYSAVHFIIFHEDRQYSWFTIYCSSFELIYGTLELPSPGHTFL